MSKAEDAAEQLMEALDKYVNDKIRCVSVGSDKSISLGYNYDLLYSRRNLYELIGGLLEQTEQRTS
jgi:hypothetical protein